ncbi:MAG: short-chain dehydrogenase [Novosphingobium sp. 63-713]|uniref:SDR family NAD(P)-dependent oxidoreductase n=1 Tax=unclassified Novosphingobium TaxID=2644732 RepID=UPI000869FBBE|nr:MULTISPECIES: SDR family NAD(P)-dependent oxidoreductase [unclassified Novosphingobium]MBN9145057.1 SDR family NAD(P)-dependent oxidoreductase [Novosphingobium sp.]MDR6708978.1 NAD(P)-dependent dehydrogenase (short-subunit alcohol dehydrogenase family) [Novosphingobium sp. 1748]ODU70983.1 MAG: short-chain dehydrogenase [Novosphingobium sp. SCN 66-18]OJX89934.1 MAG: short-chain dehydrogenase [Novosphingobium sp. 63-713]
MIDFAGRTAFVTGGANGVGLGLVRALLARGCRVAIADIREESIALALATLDNAEVMGVQVDVSSREGMAAAADEVEARFGPVSLLFNNAGINLFQTIEDSSWSDWDWVMGVNLHGVINGVMTFVPRMIAAGNGGYIVNTASMAGWLASGAPGIYNTTKFAVRGMSESLRYSLAKHGIGVSILCPGLVKSYIYASDDVRPAGLMEGAKPVDHAAIERLAGAHQAGMEPDVIAERVMQGMEDNRTYIFSHPEFREEVAELFEEYLADFRDYAEDPGFEQRLGFEKFRRERYKEAREAARKAT